MRTRGGLTGSRRLRALMLAAACGLIAAGIAGCGGDDDVASEPRPAAPIEITASIKDRAVEVSPSEVSAGLAHIVVANMSADPARLTLSGPVDDSTYEIAPQGTARLQTNLEPGTYEVTAGESSSARTSQLRVGPERPSAQNELLLP